MSVKDGYSFDEAYRRYLSWFQEKAVSSAVPKDQEAVLGFQLCHEDVFENDSILLNRMFFIVPLLPSESKSGLLELFAISELNLLQKAGGDVEDITPVEYTVQLF